MKKTYLDKYMYELERLPHKDSNRVDVIVRIDPIDDMRSTDLLLALGSTQDIASIEAMPFKVEGQTTTPSDLEEGMLCTILTGHQL